MHDHLSPCGLPDVPPQPLKAASLTSSCHYSHDMPFHKSACEDGFLLLPLLRQPLTLSDPAPVAVPRDRDLPSLLPFPSLPSLPPLPCDSRAVIFPTPSLDDILFNNDAADEWESSFTPPISSGSLQRRGPWFHVRTAPRKHSTSVPGRRDLLNILCMNPNFRPKMIRSIEYDSKM